ncbi:MAG: FkbM family methyltransferase [bacterium]|nr:FkbM family methyltransferase [bacterium]
MEEKDLTILYSSHMIDTNILGTTPTIVDLGACQGKIIDFFIEKFPESRIIAIEPCISNIESLKKKFSNIEIIHAAIAGNSYYKDEVIFHEFIGLEEWGNITKLNMETNHTYLKKIVDYSVPCIHINKIFELFNISGDIDYLKMDIEGCEEDVLCSIEENLAKKIKQISFEKHPNVDPDIVYNRLLELGFNIIEKKRYQIYAWRA